VLKSLRRFRFGGCRQPTHVSSKKDLMAPRRREPVATGTSHESDNGSAATLPDSPFGSLGEALRYCQEVAARRMERLLADLGVDVPSPA
jgi:hypothetical protein